MGRFRPRALAIAFGLATALLGGVAGYHLRGEPAAAQAQTSPAGRWQVKAFEEARASIAVQDASDFLATLDPACVVAPDFSQTGDAGTVVFVVTYRC